MADHPFKRILEDDAFKSVIADLKNESIRKFTNSQPADTEDREIAYFDLQAVGRLENRLRAKADGEKMSDRKK